MNPRCLFGLHEDEPRVEPGRWFCRCTRCGRRTRGVPISRRRPVWAFAGDEQRRDSIIGWIGRVWLAKRALGPE